MAKVIIDKRESKEIKTEIAKEGLDIEEKQLEVADFIIYTKDLENKVQCVGIERKTTNDLLNSIIDRRLLNQLSALKENFDIPILIIEGKENIYALRNFHPNSIRGVLSTIAIDFQVSIIPTLGPKDTAKYISLIAKRLEKVRRPLDLLPKRKALTPKEKQLCIISSFPGIGINTAKYLLDKFGSINRITNASEKDLMEVDNIGKIKAKELKEIFELKSN